VPLGCDAKLEALPEPQNKTPQDSVKSWDVSRTALPRSLLTKHIKGSDGPWEWPERATSSTMVGGVSRRRTLGDFNELPARSWNE
jgi:hypothetical protein